MLCGDRLARSARPGTRAAATASAAVHAGASAEGRLRLHRQQTFALQLLAGELACAAHGFRLFAGFLFRGLFVMAAELHLAENALALHLLLQRLEGLIDIVVTDENLHASFLWLGMVFLGLMCRSPPIAAKARPRGLPIGRACSRISAKSPSPRFRICRPLASRAPHRF